MKHTVQGSTNESGLIEIAEMGKKWKYYGLTRKGKKLVEPSEQTHFLVVLSIASVALVGVSMVVYASFGGQHAESMVMQKAIADQTSAPASIQGGPAPPSPSSTATAPAQPLNEAPLKSPLPWLGGAMIGLSVLLYALFAQKPRDGNRRNRGMV